MPRGKAAPTPLPNRFATSFVGREALLAAVGRAMDEHRVVTLLGPPGAGKSRLAAEILARMPERTGWCSVEGVTSVDEVAARLASAAGARLLGDREPSLEALAAAVHEHFDRVLLDDAEAAQPEIGAFLVDLLDAAPSLRVLVTSRVRLGIGGEMLIDVPPLDVAEGGEAEQLFLQRARLVRPDLALDAEGRRDLQALVRALDGLPLALELAAAQSRFLPLGSLVERMLGQGALWGAIERSLEGLSPATQAAFAQLGVFRGGFSLEAAEAVIAGPEAGIAPEAGALSKAVIAAPETTVVASEGALAALSELSERSLVATRHAGRSPRFGMLNPVRAVAESRLDPAAVAAVRARHVTFFAALAERWTREDVDDATRARHELSHERDNLAAALENAGDHRLILTIAWAVLHQGTGPLSALFAQLDGALAVSRDAPIPLRARAIATLVTLARELDRCGDVLAVVEALVAEARVSKGNAAPPAPPAPHARDTFAGERAPHADLVDETPDPRSALAVAEAALGETLTALGRFDEGARALAIARDLERAVKRPVREARALHAFGVNRVEVGRLGEGRLALREAQALLDGRDPAQEARTLAVLGVIEIEEGRLAEAKICLERALPIAEESDDRRLFALATTNHAVVAHESGDLDAAILEYERAADLCRAAGMRRGEALARAFAGHCYFERGQFGAARAAYEEALARLAKEGWRRTMVLAPYAAAAAMEGDVDLAARTLDEADASLRAMGQERLALAVHVCRGFLDLAEADRLRARGDDAGAARHVEAARVRTLSTLVDPTPRSSSGGGPALAQQSTDLRVALRALRRAVAERAPAASAPEASWKVTADGGVLTSPSGERTDLTRRAPLRRVVARLAAERVQRPGDVLRVDDLVIAGWPGEDVKPKAGEARVYAAVATLRKLGLATLLQSTGDGYRFDPSVPFHVSGRAPEG